MKEIVFFLPVQPILITSVMTKSDTIQCFDSMLKTGVDAEALPSKTIEPMPEAKEHCCHSGGKVYLEHQILTEPSCEKD